MRIVLSSPLFRRTQGSVALVFLIALLVTLPAHAHSTPPLGTRDPQRAPMLAPNVATWANVDNGVQGVVRAIAVNGTDVYVGGDIEAVCGNSDCSSGNTNVNRIVKWNGASWSSLGNGVNAEVNALVFIGNDLYAAGGFEEICGNPACDSGNITVHHIAKWNGTSWSTLANGVDDDINALAVSGTTLYAGGVFGAVCGNGACDSGNTTVNRIAKWNGSSWSTLANGVSGPVHTLAAVGANLYAGGDLTAVCGDAVCASGNTTVNHLARWNGSAWSALANGVGDSVVALAASGTDVYIGGLFSSLCQDLTCTTTSGAQHIAKWNGTTLSAVGTGLNAAPYALYANDDGLYAGGEFVELCGNATCNSSNTPLNRIAKWTGAAWVSLDDGLSSTVKSITAIGGGIIVGGYFDYTCGDVVCGTASLPARHLARYGDCMSPPTTPTLAAPRNKTSTTKTRVTLKWNAADCAATYNVTVQKNKGGTAYSATNLTALQVKTPKLAKGNYKWFAQACNSSGCTKSKVFKFTIQ